MAKRKASRKKAAPKAAASCAPGTGRWWHVLVLVIGVCLLLRDLGQWEPWGLQPWTFVFLLLGLCFLCKCK